jgi:hypothetical protein
MILGGITRLMWSGKVSGNTWLWTDRGGFAKPKTDRWKHVDVPGRAVGRNFRDIGVWISEMVSNPPSDAMPEPNRKGGMVGHGSGWSEKSCPQHALQTPSI